MTINLESKCNSVSAPDDILTGVGGIVRYNVDNGHGGHVLRICFVLITCS